MALPNAITQIMGVRDTADASSLSIDPKQGFAIGKEIFRLNPNEHQLLSWVMANSGRKPTKSETFFHMEKAPLPSWVVYDGADETSQGVTGLSFVNGGTRLTTAARISVVRTGEVIRLNADMSTNATQGVTRNDGSSGAPLLKTGDKCKLLTTGHTEGRTMGEGPSGGEVVKTFHTTITDEPVQLTGTKAAESNSDGSAFDGALFDAWELFEDKMESELLLGATTTDDSTYTYPYHTTDGLLNWISTNVTAVDGSLTRLDFWDIIGEWRKFNKSGGAIVCSGELITLISEWAYEKVTLSQDMQALGVDINQIVTPNGGRYELIDCDLLGQEETLMGTVLLIPGRLQKQGIDFRPLIGTENRDIAYKPVNRDEVDLKEGCIFGEYAWEYFGEERFAVISGIDF